MPELYKHERKTRIIGIPVLGMLITVFFYFSEDAAELSAVDLLVACLTNIVITFLFWQGNVSIFDWIRGRFSESLTKRLLLTFLASLVYNTIVSLLLVYVGCWTYDVPFAFEIFLLNFLLGMSFTLIIGSIYEIIFYFNKWRGSLLESEKLRRDFANAEYETLKNQVNPHFLFNSMNALSALVHSDADKAERFIEEFSKVYRYILEKKDEVVVTLKEELDFVRSYIFLQEIRFGENLHVSVAVPGELMNSFLPPVSLQLLVENAIKHNVVAAEMPLYIEIYHENNMIAVKNNLQKRKEPVKSTGVGIKNLQAKYKIISQQAPEFFMTKKHYIAQLPLITEDQHESTYH